MTNWQSVALENIANELKNIREILEKQSTYSNRSRAEGEWYRQTTDHFDYWECSECGMGVGLDDIKNYCPNCGAKMRLE